MIQSSNYCVYTQRKWNQYVRETAVCPSDDITNNSHEIESAWVSRQKDKYHMISHVGSEKELKEKSQSGEKNGRMKVESWAGIREPLVNGYQFSVKLE